MTPEKINRLEHLLGRALSADEKVRLHRIKDTLQISDNDALWDIIVAMEYQRQFYDELPEKISQEAEKIFRGLSGAADKEMALAQNRLAECVVEQVKNLSAKEHLKSRLTWGVTALFLLLFYGSLLMWAGYSIGTGKTQPASLLQMPVGILFGALFLVCGVLFAFLAARLFSEGKTTWRKNFLFSLVIILIGSLVFSNMFF